MEREEPKELELSLLALLDPVIERSSEGRLVLFPDSSARTAMTCLGSVLLPPWLSLPLLLPLPPLSAEPGYLLKGLNGS